MIKLKVAIVGEISKSELVKVRRAILGLFPGIKRIFPISEIFIVPVDEAIRKRLQAYEVKFDLSSSFRDIIFKFIEKHASEGTRVLVLLNVAYMPASIKDGEGVAGLWYGWGLYNRGCFVVFKGYENTIRYGIIHELGHVFGLYHCDTRSCVMFEDSGWLIYGGRVYKPRPFKKHPLHFCFSCKKEIKAAV